MQKVKLTPTSILRVWQEKHGNLTSAQRKKFLERPELRTLLRLPSSSVLRAIHAEKKLDRIVENAQAHSDQLKIAEDSRKASAPFRRSTIDKQARAKELRANQTSAERMLGERLRERPENWFAQVVMRGYILDFYCPKALLAVEVDGGAHRLTPATDAKRDEVLKSIGIETVRVSNENVIHDMKSVLQTIRRRVDKRKDIALRLKLLDHEWNLFRYGLPEVEPEPATVTKRPSRAKKFQWYCYECQGYFAGMSKSAAKCPKNNRHRATRVCSICKNQPLDGGDLNCTRCSDARDEAISSAGFGAQGPDGVQLRSATRGKRVR